MQASRRRRDGVSEIAATRHSLDDERAEVPLVGALVFERAGDAFGRRVRPLAESIGSSVVAPCDVTDDAQIEELKAMILKPLDMFEEHKGATTQTDDPYAKTKRGAAIGAAVGAAAGVFVGDGELDEILGTAAVGAGLGAGIGLYMDKQQEALEEIEEVDVERVDEETLRVNFDSDILFAVDSAILSGDAKYSLDQFAQVMRDYPQTAILIQGQKPNLSTLYKYAFKG